MQNNVLFHNLFYWNEAITTKEQNKKIEPYWCVQLRFDVGRCFQKSAIVGWRQSQNLIEVGRWFQILLGRSIF